MTSVRQPQPQPWPEQQLPSFISSTVGTRPSSKVLPTYSPVTPTHSTTTPPTSSCTTIRLVQPGAAPEEPSVLLDADRLNLVLDALDEAYDQIVVAGRLKDAAALFEAIEGRFDAAVVVGNQDMDNGHQSEDGERLLGFEVSGIDIVQVKRRDTESPVRSRSNGATKARSRELQPA